MESHLENESGSRMVKTRPKMFEQLDGYEKIRAQCEAAEESHRKWRKHRRRKAGRWYHAWSTFEECDDEVIQKHTEPTHGKVIYLQCGL
jgi:hypothetical protein